MKKISEFLVELNALRANLNKPRLADWKSSTEEIKNEINRMKKKINDFDIRASKQPTYKITAEIVEKKKAAPKADTITKIVEKALNKAKKPATEKKQAEIAADKNTTPGEAIKASGMNPKVARAKLRKAFGSNWKSKTAAEIIETLKPKK